MSEYRGLSSPVNGGRGDPQVPYFIRISSLFLEDLASVNEVADHRCFSASYLTYPTPVRRGGSRPVELGQCYRDGGPRIVCRPNRSACWPTLARSWVLVRVVRANSRSPSAGMVENPRTASAQLERRLGLVGCQGLRAEWTQPCQPCPSEGHPLKTVLSVSAVSVLSDRLSSVGPSETPRALSVICSCLGSFRIDASVSFEGSTSARSRCRVSADTADMPDRAAEGCSSRTWSTDRSHSCVPVRPLPCARLLLNPLRLSEQHQRSPYLGVATLDAQSEMLIAPLLVPSQPLKGSLLTSPCLPLIESQTLRRCQSCPFP